MPRASTSIGLVLIGTALSAMGFDAYQAHRGAVAIVMAAAILGISYIVAKIVSA